MSVYISSYHFISTALPHRGKKKRTLERPARTTWRFSSSFLSKKNKANFSSKINKRSYLIHFEIVSWLIISPFQICGKGMFQFQKAVNRGPIALCKISHISMDNFPASNATNRYINLYLCTPGWWKPILPSCQSFSHTSSFLTRSACGACILLVCQRLGENKTHIQQWDWELGVNNRSEGTHITLWHSWQALYRVTETLILI